MRYIEIQFFMEGGGFTLVIMSLLNLIIWKGMDEQSNIQEMYRI